MATTFDSIDIDNAGLVILHPFLPAYFSKLQMTSEGHFVSDEAHHRAVHLLQYLVFGKEQRPQSQMPLEKLLLGIPFGQPLPAQPPLTEQEQELSGDLLDALLKNWEKMRHTSHEGLRQSFLKRNGRLFNEEDGWILRLERDAIDVLLDTIPWSIGKIKTPWMKGLLNVDW